MLRRGIGVCVVFLLLLVVSTRVWADVCGDRDYTWIDMCCGSCATNPSDKDCFEFQQGLCPVVENDGPKPVAQFTVFPNPAEVGKPVYVAIHVVDKGLKGPVTIASMVFTEGGAYVNDQNIVDCPFGPEQERDFSFEWEFSSPGVFLVGVALDEPNFCMYHYYHPFPIRLIVVEPEVCSVPSTSTTTTSCTSTSVYVSTTSSSTTTLPLEEPAVPCPPDPCLKLDGGMRDVVWNCMMHNHEEKRACQGLRRYCKFRHLYP